MKKLTLFVLLAAVGTAWAGLGDLGKLKSLVDKKKDDQKKEDQAGDKSEANTEAQSSEPADPDKPMNKPEDVDKGGNEKTSWHGAKVGQMVKTKMMNDTAMTTEVVEVKDRVVLMKSVTFHKGKPVAKTLMYYPRYYKPVEGKTDAKQPEVKTTDLPDETLKIDGKDVKCKVKKTEMPYEGKTITTITWMSEDVPFQTVKMQNDAMGKMQVVSEVVEFKNVK
ncbi:MAG: hypothetical protein JW849_02905 [Phycisphaerae bacterium]|nr:hypothetical protein [Phycisphaerae bacterium]